MKDIHQHFSLDSLLKFVGIPYEKMDCYELTQYFYRENFDIELKTLYGQIRPTPLQTDNLVDSQCKNVWKEVTNPQFGDIILINIMGIASHIGVYLNDKHFLHSRKGVGSAIDRYGKWEKRIKGYYSCRT